MVFHSSAMCSSTGRLADNLQLGGGCSLCFLGWGHGVAVNVPVLATVHRPGRKIPRMKELQQGRDGSTVVSVAVRHSSPTGRHSTRYTRLATLPGPADPQAASAAANTVSEKRCCGGNLLVFRLL